MRPSNIPMTFPAPGLSWGSGYPQQGSIQQGNGLGRDALATPGISQPFGGGRFHVHRILTDLAWPWLIGFRRQLYSNNFWQYIDIDTDLQRKEMT